MRKFISILFLVFAITAITPGICHAKYDSHAEQFKSKEDAKRFIRKKFKRFGKVRFIQFNKLTDEELCNRAGKREIIVDITRGVCLNNKGNGRVLNTRKGYGNYISYRKLKHCRKGSRITTYCVYEPWNNETDGIWYRYDVVTKY